MSSLNSRTVVARFNQNTGMYPLTSSLVGEVLLAGEVIAMVCLRGLPGPSSCGSAFVEPLMPQEVAVRVLWAPAWVPPEAIFEMLSSISDVRDFERCRVRLADRAVHNLQYTCIC